MGGSEAAEDRMGQSVADIAHPTQDDEHPDEPKERPSKARDEQALDEEGIGEGLENRFHG